MHFHFVLRTEDIVSNCIKKIWELFRTGQLFEVVIRIFDEKSREQEEKYHAMIGDISRQMLYHGEKLDQESWKRLLVEAFVQVMREMAQAENKPDPFNGQARLHCFMGIRKRNCWLL